MSAAEIAHRILNSVRERLERRGYGFTKNVPAPDLNKEETLWFGGTRDVDVEAYVAHADNVLKGTIPIFAMQDGRLGTVPCWNRNPRTGLQFSQSCGKLVNYPDTSGFGDMKYLWEPNRHLHLVSLAQAYYLTGDNLYLEGLAQQLRSWFDQCPYPFGPNWNNPLELGIRLINWAIIWQLLGGKDSPLFSQEFGPDLRGRWLTSVYQHCHFIDGHWSRYSSANNHLIGEAAGVFIASMTWPYWKEMHSWADKTRCILLREALKQTTSDGVDREQAIAYQQFVLDFLILSGLAGQAAGKDFPSKYWARIECMLEFIASAMDVSGNVPNIGDADDGYVVRLSQEKDFSVYRSLLATGALLFNRGSLKQKAEQLDDKTRWMLDKAVDDNQLPVRKQACLDDRFEAIRVNGKSLPAPRAFPDGGYYILGVDFEMDSEIRLVANAGPLGYLSIAAHAHADALAFTLSIGGREFLVDPGTYSYCNDKWREYFRGTSAHNTVRVDGKDQSVSGGHFMWIRHAKTFCETWEPGADKDRWVAHHDGYKRLSEPVTHRREIVLFKNERRIRIADTLVCQSTHLVERFWHFSQACKVSLSDKMVIAEQDRISIKMSCGGEESTAIEVNRGQETLPVGWISTRYDVKEPTSTVVMRNEISGTTTLITEISSYGI